MIGRDDPAEGFRGQRAAPRRHLSAPEGLEQHPQAALFAVHAHLLVLPMHVTAAAAALPICAVLMNPKR